LKPAGFAYLATEGLDEALAALGTYGDEATVIAGGQSLVPLMNMRLARPGVLIDINGITELAGIELDGMLSIGALTRQQEVQTSAEVRSFAPVVVEALAHVGYPAIRSRGTFGGSAAHADPAAEIPALLVLLDAELVIRGPVGERTVAASEFFKGYFTTALEPVEILTSVRIPRPPPGIRWSFSEVARRHGDFALAGVAAGAAVDGEGTVTSVRVALFGVADTPIRATEAEAALEGQQLGDRRLAEEAGRIAGSLVQLREDTHASAGYRRAVTETLVRRSIDELARRPG
jgi:CO/xanthine dehydrogenase FAD-binding subunit